MPKLKAVVTIAVWVLFIKGFLNVILSLVAGFTKMMPMEIVEAMGGLGIVALFLACVGAWLRKKLE
jgi:hypothetical protein